ncbi:DNA binding domain-containing protein [Durusdinium trenchii]|uniref:Excisionase family n=2 Tax=Durusdinium trenchii TaxID=1381693 RepID=A0ABP0IGE3_9DINO
MQLIQSESLYLVENRSSGREVRSDAEVKSVSIDRQRKRVTASHRRVPRRVKAGCGSPASREVRTAVRQQRTDRGRSIPNGRRRNMSKKYLSLDEAATYLHLPKEELNRKRERGEIRGFADRGTWKFKVDDVEAFARTLQADSSPDVPLMPDSGPAESSVVAGPPDELRLPSDIDEGEDEISEQPTVIRRGTPAASDVDEAPEDSVFAADDSGDALVDDSDSDSDVRLVGGPDIDMTPDSDSDVKLVGVDSDSDVKLIGEELDSDSDVKLVGDESDSDVRLVGDDSDSDVQLMDGTAPEIEMMPADSGDAEEPQSGDSSEAIAPAESGIASIESGAMLSPLLADDSAESEFPSDEATDQDVVLDESEGRDSDVALLGDDESLALDADGDDNEQASVLADESGISLTGDSSLMLASESGISLEGPSDSGIALDAGEDEGITLALDNDSGISLSSGDSGISLEAAGDSGISLDDDSHSGTIPMMDAVGEEDPPSTQFEIPSLNEEEADSSYELQFEDDDSAGDQTALLDLQAPGESGEATLDDAVFDLDEEGGESFESGDAFGADEDDLEMEMDEDAFEAEEELDVFDADEEDFGADDEFVAGPVAGRVAVQESEWGTGVFVTLAVSCLLLVGCGAVLLDLVKNTATAAQPNPVSSGILEALGGLYKS